MKKKDSLADMEIYIDPTPLSKEEKTALNEFIQKLKAKNKRKQGARKPLSTKRLKENN
jgi:hypothetical protein